MAKEVAIELKENAAEKTVPETSVETAKQGTNDSRALSAGVIEEAVAEEHLSSVAKMSTANLRAGSRCAMAEQETNIAKSVEFIEVEVSAGIEFEEVAKGIG